jgi:poly(beta-D-mannuronate) lyase
MYMLRPALRHVPVAIISASCVFLTATCAHAVAPSAQPLRSPWDLHPPSLTDARYSCPQLAPLPHDIVAFDYYSDSRHSIIDPTRYAAYGVASKPFGDVENETERAADEFQRTGSSQAAACAAQILLKQAQADAMTGSMSSNQAYYVQNWAIGALAVAWLKVRPAGPSTLGITSPQISVIESWMKKVGGQVEDYFEGLHEKGAGSGVNNHFYWAGFAPMSAGIAADDRKLYDWGVGTYKFGVDQIAPDGTLPLEMGRGQRALHYHLFALEPLVTMAELASANGDDLYVYDNSRLKSLVSRTVAGLADNRFFVDKAGAPQDTPKNGVVSGSDIAWIVPYARRFPDAANTALLSKTPIQSDRYLGGLPPP